MKNSDNPAARILWEQFSRTGRIGAYMLYKAYMQHAPADKAPPRR